jgi:hypothetical protein
VSKERTGVGPLDDRARIHSTSEGASPPTMERRRRSLATAWGSGKRAWGRGGRSDREAAGSCPHPRQRRRGHKAGHLGATGGRTERGHHQHAELALVATTARKTGRGARGTGCGSHDPSRVTCRRRLAGGVHRGLPRLDMTRSTRLDRRGALPRRAASTIVRGRRAYVDRTCLHNRRVNGERHREREPLRLDRGTTASGHGGAVLRWCEPGLSCCAPTRVKIRLAACTRPGAPGIAALNCLHGRTRRDMARVPLAARCSRAASCSTRPAHGARVRDVSLDAPPP